MKKILPLIYLCVLSCIPAFAADNFNPFAVVSTPSQALTPLTRANYITLSQQDITLNGIKVSVSSEDRIKLKNYLSQLPVQEAVQFKVNGYFVYSSSQINQTATFTLTLISSQNPNGTIPIMFPGAQPGLNYGYMTDPKKKITIKCEKI